MMVENKQAKQKKKKKLAEQAIARAALEIPTKQDAHEIAHRLIEEQHLPVYVFDELEASAQHYKSTHTQLYYERLCTDAVKTFQQEQQQQQQQQSTNIFELNEANLRAYWTLLAKKPSVMTNQAIKLDSWPASTTTTTTESTLSTIFSGLFVTSADTASPHMSRMYHTLIHSECMPRLLQRERRFLVEYLLLREHAHRALAFLQSTDARLVDMERNKWHARLSHLKATQQRKFKTYVQKLHDLYQRKLDGGGEVNLASLENDSELMEEEPFVGYDALEQHPPPPPPSQPQPQTKSSIKKSKTSPQLQQQQQQHSPPIETSNRIEESYTIQLGAQLKTTHNLRLIRGNVLDLCRNRFSNTTTVQAAHELEHIEPQTIATAMSLYSNKLCAAVLLVTSKLELPGEHYSLSSVAAQRNKPQHTSDTDDHDAALSMSRQIAEICDQSGCEFHFHSFEKQVESAYQQAVLINNKKRQKKPSVSEEHASEHSGPTNQGQSSEQEELHIGDFYVTRHSNLSQVHVLFHLAAFDASHHTLKQSELSSRHPVILGLRNVLKACVNYNIHTLTFPLLLTHEMTEEMTLAWVMKRAELVLKCIKGFMIEFVQWGAQESRTLQFVVPQSLTDDTFHSLSKFIPTIFRESRTVNLDS